MAGSVLEEYATNDELVAGEEFHKPLSIIITVGKTVLFHSMFEQGVVRVHLCIQKVSIHTLWN